MYAMKRLKDNIFKSLEANNSICSVYFDVLLDRFFANSSVILTICLSAFL